MKQLGSSNIAIILGVFNKAIIPLVLVGYEIVIANSYPTRAREIIVKYSNLFFFISAISYIFNHFSPIS